MASSFTFGPALPPGMEKAAEKPVEEPKPKEDIGPSLLWDENTEIDPEHPDYAAMMALKADLTPDEEAEALKVLLLLQPVLAWEPLPLAAGAARDASASAYLCCVRLPLCRYPAFASEGVPTFSAPLNRSKGTSASSENGRSTTERL